MRHKFYLFVFLSFLRSSLVFGQSSPKEVAMAIGDKLIRETPFRYKLTLKKPQTIFQQPEIIDFGRSMLSQLESVGFAYTTLNSKKGGKLKVELAYGGGCTIWLNGDMVYQQEKEKPLNIVYGERSLELSDSIQLNLNAGNNHLLIRSSSDRRFWKVYLQVPQDNGAILTNAIDIPEIGLRSLADVDMSVASISNWLLLGPFSKKDANEVLQDLLRGVEFGKMYKGINGNVTWQIPQTDILGDVLDAKVWGTNYNWNYHNGGVAWAMQHLTQLTNQPRFAQYASRFCDFHLNGKPFVTHQVETLDALQSANSLFIHTPLLDFTLAPSLPYVYRLLMEKDSFSLRAEYVKHVDSMMTYATDVQLRMPVFGNYTRTTPVKYTTWVDDMFMGIPFLVQAALLPGNPTRQKAMLDDAANQVLAFNRQVFDEKAGLYVHARFSNDTVTLPHWSRANGWGIWATTEVLQQLSPKDPRFPVIMATFKKHVNALAGLQDSLGFWLNVLDRKDAPRETSGTAIFTMAISRGIRLGWLDQKQYAPLVWKAWRALQSKIEKDGSVHDICMGTMCTQDVDYYMKRPLLDDDTHGIFAVLFACMELELLQESTKGKPNRKGT